MISLLRKNILSTMFLYNNVKNLYQKVVGPDMDVMGPHMFGYLGSRKKIEISEKYQKLQTNTQKIQIPKNSKSYSKSDTMN